MSGVPQWAYAAALAGLPLQTHMRLRRLLSLGSPEEMWNAITEGSAPVPGVSADVMSVWRSTEQDAARRMEDLCRSKNIHVCVRGDATYPDPLISDPKAPAVLFALGTLHPFTHRRVGIIGTRLATQSGRHFARMLGEKLTAENVSVVSGLARGIDVEAHLGSLRTEHGAPPIAVVAGGPDVVYPREHESVWRNVVERGVILSEFPPGAPPEPYKFPLRNRILAALSEVLIVVESRSTGGSMTTVREAMKRDITVMAVPGSPHIKPSEGTNDLLRDGCAPVTCVDDVLVALGLDTRRVVKGHDGRTSPNAVGLRILDLMENLPRTVDEVALLSGMSVVDVAVSLGSLEAQGWVAQSDAWWEALTR